MQASTSTTTTSGHSTEGWAKSTNTFTSRLVPLLFERQLNSSPSESRNVTTKKDSKKNVLVSGLSVNAALSLVSEGAKGQTLEQLRKALDQVDDQELSGKSFLDSFTSVTRQLNTNGPNVATMANALWLSDRVTIAPELEKAAEATNSRATTLPFASDGEGSRKTINDWVEQQTHNKIQNLVPPRMINELTTLVVTNAVYFKAEWERKFNKALTWPGEFHKLDGCKVQTSFMTNAAAEWNLSETEDAKVLELPYKGQDYAMYIILPNSNTLQELRRVASAEVLGPLLENPSRGATSKLLLVKLPKFEISCETLLADTLKQLGITDAFNRQTADLTGLVKDTSGNDLSDRVFIEQVIHKAFVKVDEDGTEAAAATAVVSKAGCKAATFAVDRPFVFCVYHLGLRMALFTGIVFDPTLKG